MEVSGKIAVDEAKPDVWCDFCKLLSKIEKAEHYCVDCDEFSCNNCYIVHKGSRLTKYHVFLTKDEMPPHKFSSLDDNFCSKHTNKLLKYFCKTHTVFLCSVCVTVGHSGCTTEYIEEMATDFDVSVEYTTLTDDISRLIKQIQDIKAEAVNKRQAAKSSREKFVSDVKKFRAEINDLLDAMETTSLKEMLSLSEADVAAIDGVSTTCDSMVKDLQDITLNMEQQARYKQRRKLIISTKNAQNTIKDYENKTNDLCDRSTIKTYTFRPNKRLCNLAESLYNLGEVESSIETWTKNKVVAKEDDRTAENGNDVVVADSGEEVEVNLNKESRAVDAIFFGKINVKHSEDSSNCDITGSVMLDENRIAVADQMNGSVKVVDVKKEVVSSFIKLIGKPYDVTCIDISQLVVTCPDQKKIMFLEVNPSLEVKHEIGVEGICKGIVYSDNKLIVSFLKPKPAIKVMTLSGDILKAISEDPGGIPLFKVPDYITLSYDRKTLFVSDREKNLATNLGFNGEVIWIYEHPHIQVPLGLTTDKHGYIYIAAWWSENIHQIPVSAQYTDLPILMDRRHRAERPKSVTYCGVENKLYISHSCMVFGRLRNNAISVYQLQ